MTQPSPTQLSPEERALAERLARLGQRAEPSPALDARVMAAARAAPGPERALVRTRRRWPVAVGLVASLALAVGIAWRVRPLPPPPEGAAAPPIAVPPSLREVGTQRPAGPGAGPATPAAVATPQPAGTAPDRHSSATREKTTPAAPATPDIVLDLPAAMSAPTPPPAAVAPPEPEPAADAASQAAPARSAVAGDEAGMAGEAPPATGSSDEPINAMPPATADAPGVRDAWLARIRSLIDSGDIAGGRRSLRAFTQRYPDYPLPEDLRALLQ